MGHLREITVASKVDTIVDATATPFLPGALDYARQGFAPGGTMDNLAFVADGVAFDDEVSRSDRLVLTDAQTSGGLLISVAGEKKDALLAELKAAGVEVAAEIGQIVGESSGQIKVTP